MSAVNRGTRALEAHPAEPGERAVDRALKRLAERRVTVPDDVSVVGFDNVFGSDFCHPPLTTLAERQIKPRLQGVPGVSSVIIGGEKRFAMRLWLDRLYSVSRVDGTGAQARIHAFPLTGDGEPVTGIESWLYPLTPPA